MLQTIQLSKLRERCAASERELFNEVVRRGGVIGGPDGEQYAFLSRGAKVLSVAHVDTVIRDHHFIDVPLPTGERFVYCPQLDDRLGVYTILDLLPALGVHTDVLLTTNEERANSSAKHFDTKKKYHWLVQFDRHGVDWVSYQYGIDAPSKLFGPRGLGSYTCIAELGHLGASAFNVGVAYYREHHTDSYMNVNEYADQIARFCRFYDEYKDVYFPHREDPVRIGLGDGMFHGADYCHYCGLPDVETKEYMSGWQLCRRCWELFGAEEDFDNADAFHESDMFD